MSCGVPSRRGRLGSSLLERCPQLLVRHDRPQCRARDDTCFDPVDSDPWSEVDGSHPGPMAQGRLGGPVGRHHAPIADHRKPTRSSLQTGHSQLSAPRTPHWPARPPAVKYGRAACVSTCAVETLNRNAPSRASTVVSANGAGSAPPHCSRRYRAARIYAPRYRPTMRPRRSSDRSAATTSTLRPKASISLATNAKWSRVAGRDQHIRPRLSQDPSRRRANPTTRTPLQLRPCQSTRRTLGPDRQPNPGAASSPCRQTLPFRREPALEHTYSGAVEYLQRQDSTANGVPGGTGRGSLLPRDDRPEIALRLRRLRTEATQAPDSLALLAAFPTTRGPDART